MKNRWKSRVRGKRDREKEKERERKRWIAPVLCLFERRTLNTWSRCTHGSYESTLEKDKKKPPIGEMETAQVSGTVRAGSREKNDAPRETGNSGRRETARNKRAREPRGWAGGTPSCACCIVSVSECERGTAGGCWRTAVVRVREARYRLLEICIFVGHTSLPR